MNSIVFWSIVSFFAALGIYFIIREIISYVLKFSPSFVLLTVKNRENDIEYSIRSLLHKYPESKIIVTDNNSSDRTYEIASKMAENNNRVQVKKA